MPRVVQIARYQADGSQVTRSFEQMGQAGERMAQRVKQGANSMSPALRGIDAAAGVANQKLQGLAGSAGSLGTVLTAMGPAGLAAAAAIGGLALAFVGLQRASLQAMRQIADIDGVANQLGVATDFVQEFRFAVTGTGGDIAIADAALLSFSRNLGQLNTELGQRARGALEELGFSAADIRNMRSVEEALPRIIARIGELENASEQQAIAQKLGLEGVLQTLQAGEEAFDRLSQQARDAGFVLDRDLISRMAELEDQFKLAELQMDANSAVINAELAPAFVALSEAIADASRGLRDLLDLFKETDSVGARTAQVRAEAYLRSANALRDRFGDEVMFGGDASRTRSPRDPVTAVLGMGGSPADQYARYMEEFNAAVQRLTSVNTPTATTTPARPTGPDDAAISRMRQFVEQLEAEAAVRARVNDLRENDAKLTREEAQSIVALEADLRKLNEARDAGVIASDAELERLEALRRGRDAEAESIRTQQEEMQRLRSIEAANDNLRRQIETPEQRIQREIAGLEKASQRGDINPELAAARVRQLREEYRELAAAQHEASLQGRILAGVMQGQIQNMEDVKRVLLGILADAALQELMAGGVSGEGGFLGFLGRVGNRAGLSGDMLGGLLGGGDSEGPQALSKAAQEAAGSLAQQLTPTIADAAGKVLLSSAATGKESLAKNVATTKTGQFTVALQAATRAAQAFAAAAGGEEGGKIVGSLAKLIPGGGRAGGGGLQVGARHGAVELGPEIALFGGWAHIGPNAAVEGLGVLARLGRMAQAAPANTNAPQVTVNVMHDGGAAMDAQAQTSFGPDGGLIVDIALTRKISADLAGGKHDEVMKRYNVRPQMVRRG